MTDETKNELDPCEKGENIDVEGAEPVTEVDCSEESVAEKISENEAVTDTASQEEPAEETLGEISETEEAPVTYAFRWEYSEQYTFDKRAQSKKKSRKKRGGGLGYAAIMISVFALAFAILFASITLDDVLAPGTLPSEKYSIKDIVRMGMPSTVAIFSLNDDGTGGAGSGFIYTDSGYVITNYHVVENASTIVVVDVYDRDYSATLIGYDQELDVALLYIENGEFAPVTVGDSDTVELGEEVVAIGCPNGEEFMFSPSNGIISGLDRKLSSKSAGMLQTNAPLNPGNSGGPLFDSQGKVIGIVTSKLVSTENSEGENIVLEGMAFAIPINEALELVNGWIKDDLNKPMLGVTAVAVEGGVSYFFNGAEGRSYIHEKRSDGDYIYIRENEYEKLTDELINDPENFFLNADITGVAITGVTKGLGAYGILEPGDIVTEINGQRITGMLEIKGILAAFAPGDTVKITYYRNGKYVTSDMTLKTKGDMHIAEGFHNP